MEILQPERYDEYEDFVRASPYSQLLQSVRWHNVKSGWGHEVVVSRDAQGRIAGGMSILIKRFPFFGTAMLYAPRGPVCNLHDKAVVTDLIAGADAVAIKHKAHLFKMDPDVLAEDTEFHELARELGFTVFKGPEGFETIQVRFNYRLYIQGRDEEALLANLTQKTRYNIRVAMKKGVEVRVGTKDDLDDFMRLMTVTGKRDGFNTRPKSYFENMLDSLGEYARLYLAYYQGKAVSGAIATNYGDKTNYVYGCSDNEYRNVMPNYLMQWEMIRWALETGCGVYDFQGVSGNFNEEGNHKYGLYRFKKGFNGTLDELAGEFDKVYMPVQAKLLRLALRFYEWLKTFRRKLRPS